MFFGGSQFSPERDIPSQEGKVIVVTGGNTGIGKETILQLCKHSPKKVFLATRNEAKAKDAITSINSQLPEPADVEFVSLNLSNLASVASAAETIAQSTDRIDLLFLNAGIMNMPPGNKTDDGFDLQLGTNHVGHFLFTKKLLPVLKETVTKYNPDVRVISTSSIGYRFAPSFETIISTEKLSSQGQWTSYGASKAANILFAAELAKRHPELTSVSVHPGMIQTDLYATTASNSFLLRNLMRFFGPLVYHDVAYGALTQLWAATVGKDKLQQGGFYVPIAQLESKNKYVADADMQRRLWEWTEGELKQRGY
ncbi:NAD(P)-binding protein [Trichoderma citrinoviride]|uniref:NAD(P)-binding protein n=1 Tax=Trichoderma citrinoviride TaxID=58853 RepID=A0A2T4BJW2_9HYPO|nr:NAD(P)-binding protein [Trichoderma citrinoviride]PTB69594.1 NAD(P)-binding protein [Trichoderma citrinoviride]